MRIPGHGPGYRFYPTDVELTMYYLKNKVTGGNFYPDGIQDRDVYNLDPRDLKGPEHCKGDLKWYFFCPRERKFLTGKRIKRSTEQGSWSKTGNDRPVYYKDENVGMIKSLVFYKKNPKQRTDWVMHEYRLQDDYLKQLGLEEDAFVLCVIFEKDGLGPKNGDQYVSTYREEDWDNEELTICDKNNQGTGALSLVCDTIDRGKSTVHNGFDLADRYCAGSSSRTSPSYIDQSSYHGFQPTPILGNLPVNSQLPLTNQLLSASIGNEQAQVRQSSIPDVEKNIYRSLSDLLSLDEIHDSGVNTCDNNSLVNRNIPPDDFMEVDDCRDGSDSFEENLSVGVSYITPSWNGHHHEPAPVDHFINGTQTDSRWFISSNFSNSTSSPLYGPSLDQHSPVSIGSMGFNSQGLGEYEPFWENHQFSDGLCFQDFDDGPYFKQYNQLDAVPVGFGGQDSGENLLYMSPYLQFAQGTDWFVSQSSRENVTPLHGTQFEDSASAWRGPGTVQNVQHLNQRPQTADGSIWLHGQESSMNGQMDRDFAGISDAAPFGNVPLPQSIPREAPVDGGKGSNGYAVFFLYGDSSVRFTAKVNPSGWYWCTDDALSNGLEEFSIVTVECNRDAGNTP
ncbi:hypothetical protein MLD38_020430 [Melastoma candidum]|uniref:Uncharacterized protein n=1 Tax=Melastoma candidum TaxID=119954 RepID=A0ACB9QCC8_9MYRT|nr:hypothetical protein MLD38_020430 [Melastoma candidum]